MSGGGAVFVRYFFSKRFEYLLQGSRSGDDYAQVDDTEIEKQTEVVQIPIKERVLIIPLDLQANAPLETIDLVSGRVSFLSVNVYFGRKLLFLPASLFKEAINACRDDALTPPPFKTSLRRNLNVRSVSITSVHSFWCAVKSTPAAFRHS